MSAIDGGREAAVFCFWFSHPALGRRSDAFVHVADAQGNEFRAFRGNVSSSIRDPNSNSESNGWFIGDFAFEPGTALPESVTVRLDYTLGPWTYEQKLVVRSNLSQHISAQGGQITGPGETLEHRAFIGLVRDPSQGRKLQYDFEAETSTGQRLDPVGTSASGTEHLLTQQFEFGVPLQEVRAFHLRTRPVRTVEFRQVSMHPGNSSGETSSRTSSN